MIIIKDIFFISLFILMAVSEYSSQSYLEKDYFNEVVNDKCDNCEDVCANSFSQRNQKKGDTLWHKTYLDGNLISWRSYYNGEFVEGKRFEYDTLKYCNRLVLRDWTSSSILALFYWNNNLDSIVNLFGEKKKIEYRFNSDSTVEYKFLVKENGWAETYRTVYTDSSETHYLNISNEMIPYSQYILDSYDRIKLYRTFLDDKETYLYNYCDNKMLVCKVVEEKKK